MQQSTVPAKIRGNLRLLLIKHEDYRLKPYPDLNGNIIIGIGHNLTSRGIPPTVIDQLFDDDTSYFYDFLMNKFSWFTALNDARQIALVDMCFMGTAKFMTFTKMIDALSEQNYVIAAAEILNSAYAKEVGKRANDLAYIILSGELHI